ncbi:hypothetical protein MsAg5_00670 [Methanosarcinaceae archaeon Ag5]|uniref:Glycerophosphoryl diester phosphodiesterase membrane domain-containing protein n=1 Tax=Methanolapillus africanus TaxID=3028297 RepID=A0AAE4MHW4_9EURY|nr:hypothetical protein [Methanosarcinaceae archaeon Ag5]
MSMEIFKESVKKAFGSYKMNFVSFFVGAFVLLLFPLIVMGLYTYALYADILSFTMFVVITAVALIGVILLMPLLYGLAYQGVKGTRSPDVAASDIFFAFKSGDHFIRSLGFGAIALTLGVIVFIIAQGILYVFSLSPAHLDWLSFNIIIALALLVLVIFMYPLAIYVMDAPKGVKYSFSEASGIMKSYSGGTIVALIFATVLNWISFLIPVAVVCGYLDFLGGSIAYPEELVAIVTLILLILTLPFTAVFLAYMVKDTRPTIHDTAEEI